MKARPTGACTAARTKLDVSTVEARVTTLITKLIEAHRRGLYWTRQVFWPANSVACPVGVKLSAALLDLEEARRCRRHNSRTRVKRPRSPAVSAVQPCRSVQ